MYRSQAPIACLSVRNINPIERIRVIPYIPAEHPVDNNLSMFTLSLSGERIYDCHSYITQICAVRWLRGQAYICQQKSIYQHLSGGTLSFTHQ